MNHYQFARNLVKGRIAETIFAQMLRESEAYIVLEFGYEKVIPELTQYHLERTEIADTIRTAPDFAVIDREEKKVHLIEVKYRHNLNPVEIRECAERMHVSWNPSFIFVATLDGFYFDSVESILTNNGQIKPFTDAKISPDVQAKYLQMLRDFETGE